MNEKSYSKSIANAINTFLTEENLCHFSFDEKKGEFRCACYLKDNRTILHYLIDVREGAYAVYAYSPFKADKDDKAMMAAMAEFICRANLGILNGNFEFNMQNGELCYKSFVNCEDITPTAAIIDHSISIPAVMFEKFGDRIVDILTIFGNATAKKRRMKWKRSLYRE